MPGTAVDIIQIIRLDLIQILSLFFQSKTGLAGSLKVANNFRVFFATVLRPYIRNFMPNFPQLREYLGHFEKDN